MKKLISTNPGKNYQVIGSVNVSSLKEIKEKVDAAQKVRILWKELGVEKRTELIRPLYKEFIKKRKEIAQLVTQEIGKPIKESLSDLDWDDVYFKDFLNQGPKYLVPEISYKNNNSSHQVVYEPIGVAAVIVPWNYPFANFLWGTIPNLIAGNPVVFKHSEECPLTSKLIEGMMNKLNLPKGVFSEIYGDGKIGAELTDQDINLIWFTGSSKVGKILYEIAGRKFIKSIMELGGSNPVIIFNDVEINDQLINQLFTARFMNCGQVCDAMKRLIVHKSVFKTVVEKFSNKLAKIKVGDPEDINTEIGCLVAERQLILLEDQVKDAIKKGAKIITGGQRPKGLKGAYYQLTILTNIKKNMRVWQEEVFGPVLPIISFETEKEAIELANDTHYGLGAQVFSKDQNRASGVAVKIDAGNVDINAGNHWQSCTPFGGYKISGMGREHGKWGFQELCQIKVIAQ